MRPRMREEYEFLRARFGDVLHAEAGGEDWFQIPHYSLPDGWLVDGTRVDSIPVVFLVKADYPAAAPYGFLTPAGLTFGANAPQSTGAPPKEVPFAGRWLHFSWTVEEWRPAAELGKGSNLVAWCHSFAARLREGA